ncbi:hypothetical protein NUV66_17550 [Pseudomonas sp. 32.2.56]|uniref:hypothetical protein n=1 Tax=Pseudomonas sp. 32.2.56 TaxID=2969303 RepID=UPI0021504775|nr:hypothetical protein [Pseudomonas sp. 32.2.56]MCR4511113.1 hypothetical protein [Pseudomonas sp. 32.2.56]
MAYIIFFCTLTIGFLITKFWKKIEGTFKIINEITSYIAIFAVSICSIIFFIAGLEADQRISLIEPLKPLLTKNLHDELTSLLTGKRLGSLIMWSAVFYIPATSQLSINYLIYRRRYEKVKAKLDNDPISAFEKIFKTHLEDLSTYASLPNTARVSLYRKELNNHFRCIARHSETPAYDRNPKRLYKMEGVLYKAWHQPNFVDNALPCPTQDATVYIDYQVNTLGLSRSTASQLTMKARSYHATVLRSASGGAQAILLYEDTKPGAFNSETCTKLSSKSRHKRIITILDAAASHLVPLNQSAKEGL